MIMQPDKASCILCVYRQSLKQKNWQFQIGEEQVCYINARVTKAILSWSVKSFFPIVSLQFQVILPSFCPHYDIFNSISEGKERSWQMEV